MKRAFAVMYSLALGAGIMAAPDRNICDRLLRSFRENYPDARDVSWKETSGFYTVDFYEENVRSHIIYHKDGSFFRSVKYFKQQDLPFYLQHIVRKKYPDEKIFGIIEVSDASGVDYYVKMADAKVLTTVRMDSRGKLELIEKYARLQKK